MDSYLAEHDSPWLFHGSSKQRPLTTWAARSICVQAGHISGLSESDANKDGKLDDAELSALREVFRARRKGQADAAANKWKTTGLQQANTMGGGEAAISKNGKFRVFVLMGQSNMHGTARANELKPPYTEKHDRIRIWANGRWEYFVPRQRFVPGVSFAHQWERGCHSRGHRVALPRGPRARAARHRSPSQQPSAHQ